jgi:glutathione reductase (NADPH)
MPASAHTDEAMASFDFDLVTIGAGSGGVRASRVAASYGARVAVVEERALGGTCVNVGCIPKKLLVYAAHFRDDFEDAVGFGWTVGPGRFDWATLIAAKDREIARLNRVYGDLLDGAGVTRIDGRARVEDPHTIVVGERRITAAHVLIATGSWPAVPAIPGAELGITSNEAFHLPALPARVVIVGGGYIAVEFAGIFHGLGSSVTLVHRGPLFLRGFDEDVRTTLAEEMVRREIDLRFGVNVAAIERAGQALRVTLTNDAVFETDLVMFATGRLPNTRGLGLAEAGVELDPGTGAVLVDGYSRSSVPSIHAVGDVTDRINLTPVAIAEAQALAATLFGGVLTMPDHRYVPSAVFSQPPIGSVGLTEEEARLQCGAIDVFRSRFRPLKHTLTGREERVMMKLIVDCASDRVVGCHMVGADAGEIVQGVAIALKAGATKAEFDATIGIHPTAAEELVTMRTPIPSAA